MRSLTGRLVASMVLLASAALAEDVPRGAARPGADDDDGRFNASLGTATLEDEGRHNGLPFDDESFGIAAYGGFKLRDNLSLEVSLQSDDAVDLDDIAGSGTARLDINGDWDTVSVKAVRELSLQELLSWRRDWRLFATVGYYRSDIDRTVVNLGTGVGETVRDDESGLLLGTGALYRLGFVGLRGSVEWYGVANDREAWDAGVAVQMSF